MKKHLDVLDGLRGVAALSVLVFHFQQASLATSDPDSLWLRHAHLAVDFFFCLSGYVIGYAYDDRRNHMSILQFFRARLIRLHPLVVLGVLFGLASYVLDPFNPPSDGAKLPAWLQIQHAAFLPLLNRVVCGILMLPAASLPNRFGSYTPLNVPAWSLMLEYVANIAFALVLWRLKRSALIVIAALAAIAVGISAYRTGNLISGWAWGQFPHGLARLAFSFSMGLLLFRSRIAIRTSVGFGSLSLLMIAIFLIPTNHFDWFYEFIVVTVAFPFIVAVGTGADASATTRVLCQFMGRISYPVYILHYAVVTIFNNYWSVGGSAVPLGWLISGLTVLVVVVSYAILVFYDEPVRRWLSQRTKKAKSGRCQ